MKLKNSSKIKQKFNNKLNPKMNKKFNPKKSLRLKLSVTMIMAVISIIIICWGINKLFLKSVYEKSKLVAVEEAYKFINNKLFSNS